MECSIPPAGSLINDNDELQRKVIIEHNSIVKSPIFIVGPHRSGSTFWHNLIVMSPGILRLADARFLSRPGQRDFNYFLRTQVGDLANDDNVDRMVDLCLSRRPLPGLEGALWRFDGIKAVDNPELKQAVVAGIKSSDRSLGAVVRVLLEEITRLSGYDRACVKFPVDVRHIPELIAWFPNCRIVHITRDPRALAMSKSNDPSGTARKVEAHPHLGWLIRKAALWLVISQYRRSARVHRQCNGIPNYRLFHYEDLLADPRTTLTELCKFIGSDFSEDMLEPQKGHHEHQPSSLTGKQQKAIDCEAAVRWRKVISPFDNFLVTWLTKCSMKQLGYDPTTHSIFQKNRPISRETTFCGP
jgi:hypothetical protein